MGKPLRVLMVEDSEDDVLLTIRALKKDGYDPVYERVEDAVAMRKALRKKTWDVILCDYQMPQFNGLAAIALLKKTHIDIPLIIVSGAIGEEMAVECMRSGAHDYIMKGNLSRLAPAIERELKEVESRIKNKQVEEALRESEEKYRSLLDHASDAIFLADMEGNLLEANKKAKELLGYSREEVSGINISRIHPAEVFGKIKDIFNEIITKGSGYVNDVSVLRKDGKIIPVDITGSLIERDRTKVVQSIFRDITERKRAEEALRDSEAFLSSIIENSPHAMWISDPRGTLVRLNQACRGLLHITDDEVVGKYNVMQDDVVTEQGYLPLVKQVFEQGTIAKFTIEYDSVRLKNLELREHVSVVLDITISPVLDADGRVIYAIIQHIDITERRRAEEVLRESEEKYRAIIENMEDGYHEVDIKGNFTFFNESMRKIMGYEREELLGMNNRQYADEENTRKVYQTYNRVYRTGEPVKNFEWQIIRKDGDRRDIEVSISLIRDMEAHPIGFRGIVRDATERRRVQEDLRQAEERYRSIFENAQEGIYRSTPGGRIILANQTMAKIFGYASPEELMSGITDVARQLYVDPEERAKIQKMIEKHGFVRNCETQLYRKDGSIIWISMTMHAVRDEKGQVLYYEGMDEDITDRKENVERMRKALGATVQAIAMIVETRDPYTAGHQRRVADLARSIATEMKLPVDQIDGIRMAAAIHDLGKISVPAEILSKPTKLTALEFSLIKTHAQSGCDILKNIYFPWPIARIILEHHEWMNGSGYPNGLTGDNLLMESRILAVADVVEAMASHRPYRPGLGLDAALEEIEKNKGTLYDASAVDACMRLFWEKGYQLEGT